MSPAVGPETGPDAGPDTGPDNFAGARVLVTGAGVAGAPAARALLELGAEVLVADRPGNPAAQALAADGARLVADDAELPAGLDLVVTSPGWAPHAPMLARAAAAGLEIIGEPELAWRLRGAQSPPWLAVTGTNGKTTTVTMLDSILRAAGKSSVAVGNIGRSLVEVVRSGLDDDGRPLDVLAVELSSFQLHWSTRLAPAAGVVLNLADDHLDWHGSFDAYAGSKAAIWRAAAAGTGTAVVNADDARVVALQHAAAAPGVGFTIEVPGPGELGVVEDLLVDRAFTGDPRSAQELGTLADVHPAGAHNVSNALAAAALARSFGVAGADVAAGLAGYQPQPHRNVPVARLGEVTFVDDSKATNPHAALASLRSYPDVVWVAGGQLKGVDPEELVAAVASRLRAVVLLGVDRALLAAAVARHAPDVPVFEVARTDDGAMDEVVRIASGAAGPGHTVLLAPAAASYDMFTGYPARGKAFAAAARALGAVAIEAGDPHQTQPGQQ